MLGRKTLGAIIALAISASAVTAATASAKELVLSTEGAGVLTNGTMEWTSNNSSSFSFDEEGICPENPLYKLKWKVNFLKEGGVYNGQISQVSQLNCTLSGGGVVSIDPVPSPWSIQLSGNGKATIKPIPGAGPSKIEFTAVFPDGRSCTYGISKIGLTFVVGPLHPVPLEPGDPASLKLKLIKPGSSNACSAHMGWTGFMYAVQYDGPDNSEPVLVVN